MSTHTLIEALERIAAEECEWTGGYENCAEAAANPNQDDFRGPCPGCIARTALATHRAGTGEPASVGLMAAECAEALYRKCGAPENLTYPVLVSLIECVQEAEADRQAANLGKMAADPSTPTGEPHAFADCIKADGDKPCRDCAEYAVEAVGAPRESGGTRALLMWEAVDRELQAIRQHEANPTRGGQNVGDGPKWLGLVRAPFVRKELEWYARESLALPPLAAAAIQESPKPVTWRKCARTDCGTTVSSDVTDVQLLGCKNGRPHLWEPIPWPAPPPADVEVPQRRGVAMNKCDTCDGYGHKAESDPRYAGYSYCPDCPNGRRLIARAYPASSGVEPPRPEAAPTCGTCKGAKRVPWKAGLDGACPDCTAPRALQGECKAWCGRPLRFMPEGPQPYWLAFNEVTRVSDAYDSRDCRDAGKPLHPPSYTREAVEAKTGSVAK